MYCPNCNGYVPTGIDLSQCPNCSAKITELMAQPQKKGPASELQNPELNRSLRSSVAAKSKEEPHPKMNKMTISKKYFVVGVIFFVVGGLVNGVFVRLEVSGIFRELSRLITLIGFFALVGSFFLKLFRSKITISIINIVAVLSISLLVFYNVKKDMGNNSDYVLALKYAKQGKYDDEITVWSKLLELNPSDYKAQSNIGQAYLQVKRYDDALSAFESAIKLKPSGAGIDYFNAGVIYASRGDLEKAKAYFLNANSAGYAVPNGIMKKLDDEIASKNVSESVQKMGNVITQAVNEGILTIDENNKLKTAPFAGPPVPSKDGQLKIGMTPEEVLGILGHTLQGRETRFSEDGTKEEDWIFPDVIVTFKNRKMTQWKARS